MIGEKKQTFYLVKESSSAIFAIKIEWALYSALQRFDKRKQGATLVELIKESLLVWWLVSELLPGESGRMPHLWEVWKH